MQMRRSRWLTAGALTAATLLALTAPAGAAEASPSAYVAKASLQLPGAPPVAAGPLAYADRGTSEAGVASISVANVVSAGAGSSTVAIDPSDGAQTATSTLANLRVSASGLPALSVSGLTTTCTARPGSAPTGRVELVAAQLGATALPADPPPNTAVDIPGVLPGSPPIGRLVLNEQISNADGSLTVYGAHLTVDTAALGSLDVVVTAATCGPVPTAQSPEPKPKPKA